MCFRPPEAQKLENKCPKCETVNLPEAEVCSQCGEALPKFIVVPPPGVSAKNFAKPPAPPPGVPPKAPAPPPKVPPTAPPVPPKKPGDE